ncbi:MAG: glycosyltransferase family 4 protein [Pirellulales bacterium]
MAAARLIIVTLRFWPSVGRVERYVGRLVEALPGAGWPVTVLTPRWVEDWPTRLTVDEGAVVRFHPAPLDLWSRWRYDRQLGRWLRKHVRPEDVVLAVGLRHEAATVIRAVGQRAAVVLVAPRAVASGEGFQVRDTPGGRRLRRTLLNADAVVAPSDAVREQLSEAGFSTGLIRPIAWGVPVVPAPSRKRRAEARRILAEASDQLRVPEGAPIGLYIGRLDPDRRLPLAVAAWEPIARRWPGGRLWLVGPGPERTRIDRQVADLRLTGRVQTPGVFEQVETLLDAADLLVHPAPTDDVALPVLEALGAGLPVVADDSPGHRRAIEHERTGLLVPAASTAEFSAAMARVINSPALAARLSETGRRWAAEHHSLETMIARHVTLLRQAPKTRGKPPR